MSRDDEQTPDSAALKQRIADAIIHLPAHQKLVIALYYYERLDFSEIADILETSEPRARALNERAIRTLRETLKITPPEAFPTATILGIDGEPLSEHSSDRKRLEASITEIGEAMLAAIVGDPDLLYELSSRRFEELVAELYHRHGFKVWLTPPSKDRGVDLYVVRHDELGSSLSVVQCKRYAPNRKVGVALVRELKGVIELENASGGVIATTSFFTEGAKKLAKEHRFRLSLQDFYSLQALLRFPRSLGGG